MPLKTRKPTGQAGWPMLLLAGVDKAGKTYQSVLASTSPAVGRTLLIPFGELDPDEYALIPGVDFEIVEHDGTYQGLLQAVRDAVSEPSTDGRPNLIVLDGASALWELLQSMMQQRANLRARIKAEQAQRTGGRVQGPPPGADDYQITSDLWNEAKRLWHQVVHTLRAHQGPVIITARLDEVAVMDSRGQPTQDKTWKVQAHKSLPYDVDGTVQMRVRREALITGFRSLRFTPDDPDALVPFPDFTVPKLWERLGVTGQDANPGRHSTTQINAEASEQLEQGNVLTAAKNRLMQASRSVAPSMPDRERGPWILDQLEQCGIAADDVDSLNDLADNWLRSDPWQGRPEDDALEVASGRTGSETLGMITAEWARGHIGASVVYTPPTAQCEVGVITSVSEQGTVFVRYGDDRGSKGTNPSDLDTAGGEPSVEIGPWGPHGYWGAD